MRQQAGLHVAQLDCGNGCRDERTRGEPWWVSLTCSHRHFSPRILRILHLFAARCSSDAFRVSNCSTCMTRFFFGLGLQRRARHINACLLCQDGSFLCLQQSCTVADVHGSLSGRMSLKATLHVGWYCVPRAPGPVVSAERRAVGSCVRYGHALMPLNIKACP